MLNAKSRNGLRATIFAFSCCRFLRVDVAEIQTIRRDGTKLAPHWTRREFELNEWMDGPCTYEEYRQAALDLERVNRLTLGYRPALQFLERVVERPDNAPLHVVDVGCGHGDGLRAIYRWAQHKNVAVRLTGVDLNPYAAQLAQECDRNAGIPAGSITWITADAFAASFDAPVDVAISSLFAHHLTDTATVALLRWNEATARMGWLVNDLRRSARAAMGFKWLTRVIGSCAMVKHDGAVSFRRALTTDEWCERCEQAAVDANVVDVGLGRLCVQRLKL
jgi:SAM-dependent methyltransferase